MAGSSHCLSILASSIFRHMRRSMCRGPVAHNSWCASCIRAAVVRSIRCGLISPMCQPE